MARIAGMILLLASLVPVQASEEPWVALRAGGAVALLRHARAPGTGDPAGFRLEDCATQRNLSEVGRDQAGRIGAAFRERGIEIARVLSSRWCRGLDTARLAFGSAEPFPALDSFFGGRTTEAEQTAALRRLVAGWRGEGGVLALVTHQVNITALTGIVPAEGEVLVLRPAGDGFEVVGRMRP